MNDSKKPCGSRVDRHEHIGKGCIGLEPFRRHRQRSAVRGAADAARNPEGRYAESRRRSDVDPLDRRNLRRPARLLVSRRRPPLRSERPERRAARPIVGGPPCGRCGRGARSASSPIRSRPAAAAARDAAPRSTTSPWRPITMASGSTGSIASSGPSTETSIRRSGNSFGATGAKRGSSRAALAAHLAISSASDSRHSSVPRHPRSVPRRLNVTNAPVASGRSIDTGEGGAVAGDLGQDGRARDLENLPLLAISEHRRMLRRRRPDNQRPPRCRLRSRPSGRSGGCAPSPRRGREPPA